MSRRAKQSISWDRLLWGVELYEKRELPLLLGEAWYQWPLRTSRDAEPTRAMLFTTRAAARFWCVRQQASYDMRPDHWTPGRFRPVRVRERVEVV